MKSPIGAVHAWFWLPLVLMARLAAQDVTVGDPIWFRPDPAPDKMPAARGRVRVPYPNEMRKTDEIGYVIIDRYLDAKGQTSSLRAEGTHVPFQRAVEGAFSGTRMRAARRDREPIDARIWLSVIFNPKSASTKGADATPRLFAVTPVFARESPSRAGMPPVVHMRLSLDAAGAITLAVPETAPSVTILTAIQKALVDWRFAPARRNGEPVAAEVVVPVLCLAQMPAESSSLVPARVISRKAPVYPPALVRFGLEGRVLVQFDIDTSGRVQNPVITESDNPAFEEPAITALRECKFLPATVQGVPISSRMLQSLKFEFEGREGTSWFTIREKGDQSNLPPELRYDTPPKFRGVLIPVYPYEARREKVRGNARAMMLIDHTGNVAGVEILSADRPEFALALKAALEGFKFDPALRDGRPVPFFMNLEQTFSETYLPDPKGQRLLATEKKRPEKILTANILDAPPKPISRRAPCFPTGLPTEVTAGKALVEFLIDEDGRAKLPRIVSASDPAFGYAAVQSVSSWWFEPPMSNGRRVAVRVRIPFSFSLK